MLRQLSAIFDTRALGYSSALVAAKVDPEHIDDAAAVINQHPGVSHNYKRNHAYNLWYTLAVPPGEDFDAHLDELHRDVGRDRHPQAPDAEALQDRREARHDRQDRGEREGRGARAREARAASRHGGAGAERPRGRGDPHRAGGPPARARARSRCRPSRSALTEDELLAILHSFIDRKLMRRFAAVMNHRSAGFKANAMGVWAVPEDELEEIGPQMAGFAAVSHCYRRPTYEDWPYTVFTMVHGRTAQRLRGHDRRDRERDRRRRVHAPLVDQGVQEDPRHVLHAGVGRLARRAPRRRRLTA